MIISNETLQQLRDIPIRSVGSRLGLTTHHGRCLCPFHADRNPSASYARNGNYLHCFSCGTTADTIALTQKVLGVGFKEACEWLMKEQGQIIEQHPPRVETIRNYPPDLDYLRCLMRTPYLNEPARHFLFDERQYDERAVRWLGISSISQPTPCWRYGRPFFDANSLLFPFKNLDGEIMGCESRLINKTEGKPRFKIVPNSSVRVFNLPILKYLPPNAELWLCEGLTDVVARTGARQFSLGIQSAYSLRPDDLACLPYFVKERGVTLHCAPDNDSAGNSMYQSLQTICNRLQLPLVRHKIPDECKDFSDYYLRVKREHNNNFELPE